MKFLKTISEIQYNHAGKVAILTLIITIILGSGLTQISMQSDMDQMYPQDLEVFQIADRIQDAFGGQDSSMILLRLEDTTEESIYDIRDPTVIEFLVSLSQSLEDEDLIESIQSAGMIFAKDTMPETLEQSRQVFAGIPTLSAFFNDDYSATMVIISSDLGGGEAKIKELESLINDAVDKTAKPEGVAIYITGTPQIRTMILNLLTSDAIFTLSLAAIIIYLLLLAMERSLAKATLIFLPLIFGITWTLGSMGWLGIQLSIATVGIGAMILGLGVEYGVFIVSRYKEERKKKSQQESLTIAVQKVGGSILGSGTTTISGFLVLTISMMPMLQDLGLSLALGIAFSLIAAVFINPSFIILEEKIFQKQRRKNDK